MLVSILLVVSIITNIVMGFAIKRSLVKVESYDDFFEVTRDTIKKTIEAMEKIDIRGSFQSDDEVGSVFDQMKGLVTSLDVFLLNEDDDEKAN